MIGRAAAPAEPGREIELHIAALPFPSRQGTQAAIRAMLEARVRAGRRVELFTYATAGYAFAPSFGLHRAAAWPAVSLRSGPSLRKLIADARMLVELRRLLRRLRPSVIVAHHVEAALLALAAGRGRDQPRSSGSARPPCVFFAHTDLAHELPTYAARPCAIALRSAGAALDRLIRSRVAGSAAISPALAQNLRRGAGSIEYVPLPWPLPRAIEEAERQPSRRELGLAADGCTALYAGNLDAYQAPLSMLDALAQLRAAGRSISLLLATDSDSRAFLRRARALNVPVRTSALGDESLRRRLHAAADFAIVPRATPFGLPIKLLDALARGLPCAVAPAGEAGLPAQDCFARAAEAGLAAAIEKLARDPVWSCELARRGRAYVARAHSDERFNVALDRVIAAASGAPRPRSGECESIEQAVR
jgi:glycosyltransferase involved in cell wall biosynthesis